MRREKKIKFNNKCVSSVIGSILMVVITIILSAVLIQMINTHEGPKDKRYAELIADLVLKSEKEGGGGIVEITHNGGDVLEDEKTIFYIDIDNQRKKLKISDGIKSENKDFLKIGGKWSKYFSEITKDSNVKVTVIDKENKEILMKGRVQAGLSFPDYSPPVISITWCSPSFVTQEGREQFKIYATIVDSENNMPSYGTVTVNLLPISASEAEPMFDFDGDGVYETRYLAIKNGTNIGTYTFKITALDKYGNRGEGEVSLEVGSLDTIPPTIEITKPSINSFVNSTPLIIGTFSDNVGGSGIDESSITLKIDNKDVKIEELNISSSEITYMPKTNLNNGTHTVAISLKDKAGNFATTSLTFITGGYIEPYCIGGPQNFIILNQQGKETTYFEEGEMIRIRVSSSFLQNAETKNRITIIDSFGNSTIIDQAFTLISNTAPYLFYDYCYACVFDAPSAGYYKIKIEIIDSNGNKFLAKNNLTVGKPSFPYYFKTYADSNYSIESDTFNSTDNIYVKIVTSEKGQVNNTFSKNIYVDDYISNHQIINKPGERAISNVEMSAFENGFANYTFSINLSRNQYGWLQSSNWYTLSIEGLKNKDNNLIFKGATQIQIINSGKPDLEIEDSDITLSNNYPTLGDIIDISIIVHNVGIVDAFNVLVGIWEDNELIGEQNIPIIFANGGDEEITIQWKVRNQNATTLRIVADPYYKISEYDETNNLVNKQVKIKYPILLVDDDDGDGESWNVNIENYWIEALDSNGYLYNLYTVLHGENGPNFDILKNYDVVIWFTGRDNFGDGATLTSIDQSNLAMYLEDGGNLWIISQSLLYVMSNFDNNAPLTNAFAHEYLKVNERFEDEGTKNPLLGVDGDPITDRISYQTSSAIFNGDDYCDEIILEEDSDGIFYATSNYCAVRYDSDIFKIVFFAYEFAFISNAVDRAELVDRVLNWFGVHPIENDVGISSLFCPENVEVNEGVNITATIKNFGRIAQKNFGVECSITAKNGTIVYSNTKSISLYAKDEKKLTWTWIPDNKGIYIICVSTQLLGDENNTNNETSAQIYVVIFYDDIERGVDDWSYDGTTLITIFSEDFESGNLNNWEIDTINDGGVVTISNSEAYLGNYCVKFYGDQNSNNNMWIQHSFNLLGQENVYLSWYWHDEDLEQNDYAYLSIYDGVWHNEIITLWNGHDEDHFTSQQDYEEVGNPMIIKLDEEYNMIDGFKIRFGCHAKHYERYDCLLLDNIKLTKIDNGNLWHKTNKRAHSGNYSFWLGDDITTKYISYTDNSLISPKIDLINATSASLSFWQYCDFEDYKDGGIVEISLDSGNSWRQITPNNYYDGIIDEPTNSLDSKEAFCLATEVWEKEEFSLTPYVGYKILLRFRFGSSAEVNKEGWYIDDIAIVWG